VILLILFEKALNLRVEPFTLQRFQLARLLHHQKVGFLVPLLAILLAFELALLLAFLLV
jgi:hypothetical protein